MRQKGEIKIKTMKSHSLTVKAVLHYTFGIVPVVAGLGKFTNILTDWTTYISFGDDRPASTRNFNFYDDCRRPRKTCRNIGFSAPYNWRLSCNDLVNFNCVYINW